MKKICYFILFVLFGFLIFSQPTPDTVPTFKVYRFRDGTKEIIQTNQHYKDSARIFIKSLKEELTKLDTRIDSIIVAKKPKK